MAIKHGIAPRPPCSPAACRSSRPPRADTPVMSSAGRTSSISSRATTCSTAIENFLLLSEILEKVSGLSFNDLLKKRITGPLGMHNTALMPSDDVILPRLAGHHRRQPDGTRLKAANRTKRLVLGEAAL
ncbi:serine hydrolase [Bosea sp. ANAM02]|uniref:serine hydrolase n=1 Tax=Bosea sp. ANAM02 TaxID=2020412 RepID=UPI001563ACD9|nr:serine hydrolase [Bosea sp. ANAM02]